MHAGLVSPMNSLTAPSQTDQFLWVEAPSGFLLEPNRFLRKMDFGESVSIGCSHGPLGRTLRPQSRTANNEERDMHHRCACC
jgi:hypothetical protein